MSTRQQTKSASGSRKASPESDNGAGNSESVTADKVEKIRDILFGEQMVGYDARFAELEKRLGAEIKSLEKAMEKGFAKLEDLVEKRTTAVGDASVQRRQLADELEKVASLLREG